MNPLLIFVLFSTATWFTVDAQTPAVGTDVPQFGLYWYDALDHKWKANADSLNKLPTTAFKPTNTKTIIHFHGWCPGCALAVPPRFPSFNPSETFKLDLNAPLNAPWVADGWNIGIYIWAPFADVNGTLDLIPIDAEVKITDASKTTYRYPDGSVSKTILGQSITDHALGNITNALSVWNGGQLVFTGHSLGASLVLHVAGKLFANPATPAKVKPQRVVLLDHFMFNLATEAPPLVAALKQAGIPVESYRASPVGALSNVKSGNAVDNQCVFTEIKPWHLPASEAFSRKHEFAWNWWYQSYTSPAPATYHWECTNKVWEFCVGWGFVAVTDPTKTAAAARTTVAELAQKCPTGVTNCPYKWRALNDNFNGGTQGDGVCTQYENDDSMELIDMTDPDLADIGNCKCCSITGTSTNSIDVTTNDIQSPNTATSSYVSLITIMGAIIIAVLFA